MVEWIFCITEVDMSWSDPYNKLSLAVKTLLGIFIGFTWVFGSLLLFALISFERYGGDPQKRGLRAQLSTQNALAIYVNYTLTLPVVFWRIAIGPIYGGIFWTWCFIINSYFFTIFFHMLEIMLLRFVSVVILKRMPPVVDDCMARFVLATNLAAGSFFSFISCNTKNNYVTKMRFIGSPSENAAFTPLKFNLMLVVLQIFDVIFIFVLVSLKLDKRKNSIVDGAVPGEAGEADTSSTNTVSNHQLNTRSYNKDMVTQAIELTVFCLVAVAGFTAMLTIYVTENDIQLLFFLMEDLTHPFFAMVIVPLTAFLSNQDLQKHTQNLFKSLVAA